MFGGPASLGSGVERCDGRTGRDASEFMPERMTRDGLRARGFSQLRKGHAALKIRSPLEAGLAFATRFGSPDEVPFLRFPCRWREVAA